MEPKDPEFLGFLREDITAHLHDNRSYISDMASVISSRRDLLDLYEWALTHETPSGASHQQQIVEARMRIVIKRASHMSRVQPDANAQHASFGRF
jgi:hypothetical protein